MIDLIKVFALALIIIGALLVIGAIATNGFMAIILILVGVILGFSARAIWLKIFKR